MNNQEKNPFLEKGTWLRFFIAASVMILLAFLFSWQYQQIEEKRAPFVIEQEMQKEKELEEKSVKDVLNKFMSARFEKDETAASAYLTEKAMEAKTRGDFELVNDFTKYEIIKTEKLEENKFRFLIRVYEKNELNSFVESIILVKILDQYYIDSIEIAG